MIENSIKNTAEAMNKREYRLNDEGGYGGREGWKIAKSRQLTKNVGKIDRSPPYHGKVYNRGRLHS